MKNFRSKKINIDTEKGFSLIESLISITILMISVAVPMTMAWSGLLAAHLAEDQIVAYYLAQDAMEYVHNKRDFNKLRDDAVYMLDNIIETCEVSDTDGNGIRGIDDPGDTAERGCYLSTFDGGNSVYTDNGGILYFHPGGEYDHVSTNGVLTKFKRQVRVGYIDGTSEAIVEVIVRWPNSVGAEQEYKLRSHLTDW